MIVKTSSMALSLSLAINSIILEVQGVYPSISQGRETPIIEKKNHKQRRDNMFEERVHITFTEIGGE